MAGEVLKWDPGKVTYQIGDNWQASRLADKIFYWQPEKQAAIDVKQGVNLRIGGGTGKNGSRQG